MSEILQCPHCLQGVNSTNPVVKLNPSRNDNPYICRRCIIRAALAVDPSGERIIVRVPTMEKGLRTDWITLGLQSHEVEQVADGYAAWTNRARNDLRLRIKSEIDHQRREAADAEASIEASIRDAADLGIDLNAPEPAMPGDV